jgi:hypothetical protein
MPAKRKKRNGLSAVSFLLSTCQNATALAAATLSESTPWDMGILTV